MVEGTKYGLQGITIFHKSPQLCFCEKYVDMHIYLTAIRQRQYLQLLT